MTTVAGFGFAPASYICMYSIHVLLIAKLLLRPNNALKAFFCFESDTVHSMIWLFVNGILRLYEESVILDQNWITVDLRSNCAFVIRNMKLQVKHIK